MSRLLRLADAPRPLDLLLDLPSGPGPHPVAVCCHGFKGFMEWGFWPPFTARLVARGIAAVRFNFSGGGVRPGEDQVSEPAAFRDDTYGKELADLEAVLAAVAGGAVDPTLDPGRVGLVGHSRGGGVALLAAGGRAWGERLAALVTWASIATVHRHGLDELARWRAEGAWVVENARTGQRLEVGRALLAELDADRAGPAAGRLDLEAAAARRTVPWLILHGELDGAVPIAEGDRLAAAARSPAWYQAIGGGDHTFGATHPFAGLTRPLAQVFAVSELFLARHLHPAPAEGDVP